MFAAIEEIRSEGFGGFVTVRELMDCERQSVADLPGVYCIVYPFSTAPVFLSASPGGHFKGKDPTVPISLLQSRWCEDTPVIYIGIAGGDGSEATLRSRLRQYMKFGQGLPVGHWGGRLIWQLENHRSLQVCWKTALDCQPREYESRLLGEFSARHGCLPFANLTR